MKTVQIMYTNNVLIQEHLSLLPIMDDNVLTFMSLLTEWNWNDPNEMQRMIYWTLQQIDTFWNKDFYDHISLDYIEERLVVEDVIVVPLHRLNTPLAFTPLEIKQYGQKKITFRMDPKRAPYPVRLLSSSQEIDRRIEDANRVINDYAAQQEAEAFLNSF